VTRTNTQELLLPVRQEARPPLSLVSVVPTAAFVSQLIAECDRLPPQNERRLTSAAGAASAYRAGAAISVRRMPEGFRKTVLA
jgi:hypothetical protein